MRVAACIILVISTLGLAQEVVIIPESPAPGSPAVLRLDDASGIAEVAAGSPMGHWFRRFPAGEPGVMNIEIPSGLEMLLIGYRREGQARWQFRNVELQGKSTPELWQAYFASGQPHFAEVDLDGNLESGRATEMLAAVAPAPNQERWRQIISLSNPAQRAEACLRWLEETPLTADRGRLLQLLAATFAEAEDHIRAINYGRMSLELSPADAMTLNGVAFSMAEAEVDLSLGLILADRALAILARPEQLPRPAQLTPQQWRQELVSAYAATLDTKGWLLTRLERFAEAETAFEAALARVEKDEFYLHYGRMKRRSGDEKAAQELFNKGIALGGSHRSELEREMNQQ